MLALLISVALVFIITTTFIMLKLIVTEIAVLVARVVVSIEVKLISFCGITKLFLLSIRLNLALFSNQVLEHLVS